MAQRTKLSERILPRYTRGEEIMNMTTHIVGGGMGIFILAMCVIRSAVHSNIIGIISSVIYGICMITMYTMSSVYHGLKPNTGKKVMQVIDHCTIYFQIAGTYTPIALCSLLPLNPALGIGIFAFEWGMTAIAVTLTAIDLKKYRVFSMICYIGMGWAIIPFAGKVIEAISVDGFAFLLAGGIAYTIGSILYGIGSKKHWMHSVFHIFVVLGSILQFISIFLYVL